MRTERVQRTRYTANRGIKDKLTGSLYIYRKPDGFRRFTEALPNCRGAAKADFGL